VNSECETANGNSEDIEAKPENRNVVQRKTGEAE
jgi:hypothetical protein